MSSSKIDVGRMSDEGSPVEMRWEAVFSLKGRIGRRTFWLLCAPFLLLLAAITGLALAQAPDALEVWDSLYFGLTGFSLVIAFFGVRRLHDRGITGKWMLTIVLPFALAYLPPLFPLLYLTPLFLLTLLVIVGFVPGQEGANAYGLPGSGSPFPKERAADQHGAEGA